MTQSQTLNRKQRRALEKKNKAQAKTKMAWMASKDLKLGDKIVTKDGRIRTVTSVKAAPGLHTVHNFAVEDHHAYFVGDGPGVWVHNTYKVTAAEIRDNVVSNLREIGDEQSIQRANLISSGESEEINADLEILAEIISSEGSPADYVLPDYLITQSDIAGSRHSLISHVLGRIGGPQVAEALALTDTIFQTELLAAEGASEPRLVLADSGGDSRLGQALDLAGDVLVAASKTGDYISDRIDSNKFLKFSLFALSAATSPVTTAITSIPAVGRAINAGVSKLGGVLTNALESRGINSRRVFDMVSGGVLLAGLGLGAKKGLELFRGYRRTYAGGGGPTGRAPSLTAKAKAANLSRLAQQSRSDVLKNPRKYLTGPQREALQTKPWLARAFVGSAIESRTVTKLGSNSNLTHRRGNSPYDFVDNDGFTFDITTTSKSSISTHQNPSRNIDLIAGYTPLSDREVTNLLRSIR